MTKAKYPIIYKCRICKKEFEFIDDIIIHIEEQEKIKL
tara:strand:+ start:936 stop:1049 length:114 start_codon:yes stop_codon:yes gene_type:complete